MCFAVVCLDCIVTNNSSCGIKECFGIFPPRLLSGNQQITEWLLESLSELPLIKGDTYYSTSVFLFACLCEDWEQDSTIGFLPAYGSMMEHRENKNRALLVLHKCFSEAND